MDVKEGEKEMTGRKTAPIELYSDDEEDKEMSARNLTKNLERIEERKQKLANGEMLRSDTVSELSHFVWEKHNKKGQHLLQLFYFCCIFKIIYDNTTLSYSFVVGFILAKELVMLQHPLETNFITISKEFEQYVLNKFECFAVIVSLDVHYSIILFCNEEFEYFNAGTSMIHIDPLRAHNTEQLRKYFSR